MTQFLPPNLLALFAPRDPIQYLAPVDKLPHEKKTTGYSGLGAFLDEFEDPDDTPPPTRVETRDERRERKRREKQEQVAYRLEQDIALWDPSSLPNGTTDPFKTLFIARINYDTSESKLRREFEVNGPIKKIVLVHNTQSGKPRGYAFIEYEHERDMHSAYKHADGKKMDGRRVLVDVERARTVKGWLPRRLGGGLGGTRRGGPDVNVKYSGREDPDRMRGGGDRRERSREREKRRRSRSPRERRERGERGERAERPERVERGERGAEERGGERKRRRTRSRSRDRKGRSRSPRDRRDRERRRERGDRDRRERRDRNGDDYDPDAVRVKTEPEDDYPEYPSSNSQNPPLKDEDKKPRDLGVPPPPPPPPLPPSDDANGAGYERRDEGEIDY